MPTATVSSSSSRVPPRCCHRHPPIMSQTQPPRMPHHTRVPVSHPSVREHFLPATDANKFFAFAEVFEAPTATEECSTRRGTCAIFRSFEAGGTTNSLLLLSFKSEEYSGAAAAKFDSRDAFALPQSSSSFRLLFLARLPRVFCGCFPFLRVHTNWNLSLSLIVFAKRGVIRFDFTNARIGWSRRSKSKTRIILVVLVVLVVVFYR